MKLKPLDLILIANGKFLSFFKREFLDKNGNKKAYEFVERNYNQKAVVIIGEKDEKILLIKQYRIPVLNYVIEFPAGLMEKDEGIEDCAKREFLEETGYSCKIIETSPAVLTSAGLTTEEIYFVNVEIEEYIGENPESSEDIEILWVDRKNWEGLKGSGIFINGWVYSYMEGRFFNNKV